MGLNNITNYIDYPPVKYDGLFCADSSHMMPVKSMSVPDCKTTNVEKFKGWILMQSTVNLKKKKIVTFLCTNHLQSITTWHLPPINTVSVSSINENVSCSALFWLKTLLSSVTEGWFDQSGDCWPLFYFCPQKTLLIALIVLVHCCHEECSSTHRVCPVV